MVDEKKAKILIVDDEPSVTEALRRVLRSYFDVTVAHSGEEAISELEGNEDYAIVLSDYQMPKMTGIELLKLVRKISPNTVRAIISGQIHLKEISEAINSAEIHRFFLKPWDNEYLRIQMLESAQAHRSLAEKNHLRILAITDPVTQLTNHRYFQERLIQEVEKSKTEQQSLCVVMIDVDHFKNYNDNYGHPNGDRLLFEIGQQIDQLCPSNGSTSRYGGEEFVVLLPNTQLADAEIIANKMRAAVASKKLAGPLGKEVHVTISLGLANFPENANTAANLVNSADQALYQAKRQGRNLTIVASVND